MIHPSTRHPIGVIHYGVGPIGRAVATIVASRPWLTSLGAVDSDPETVGQHLSTVCGFESQAGDPRVVAHITDASHEGGSVVLHCTGSSFRSVVPQLRECLDAGLNVISTCEELAYPWEAHPTTALELDALARRRGLRVLGTGINPGFAMDYLPMTVSAVARRVDRVVVHRRQDASARRLPLQRKIGAGLTAEVFAQRSDRHSIGHVGLRESGSALAAAFGWTVGRCDESIEPVLSTEHLATDVGDIEAGDVTGIRQTLEAYEGERHVVSLSLEMAIGLAEPADEIWLYGEPDIHLLVPGGLHGDIGTASIVVNAIPSLLRAEPGLRVMRDLPPMTPAPPSNGHAPWEPTDSGRPSL
jgi:4-hydroxy-tetrahydrodipicolinate reductase